jgi:inorganic pyrophosphatase
MRVEHSLALSDLAEIVTEHFGWASWEAIIESHPPVIDRPKGSGHPTYPSIIYPIDYGYVPGTLGSDGEPVDVFVGQAGNGLVGAIITVDYRRRDRELKLLFNCSPEEVYLVNGFINYDTRFMRGRLALRYTLDSLRSLSVDSGAGKSLA